MKLRHNVLLLLVLGIALLTVAMPVSAQLNVVPVNGTVLLGEENLDVATAVGSAAYLGWWGPTSDFDNSPDRVIDLSGYILTNFNIDDDPTSQFVGTEGKGFWWQMSTPGDTNPTQPAFQVVLPQTVLKIRDLGPDGVSTNTDVTDSSVLIGDVLDFELSQSTLHYIFLRDEGPGENFNCKIVVRNPYGVTYSKLWIPNTLGLVPDLENPQALTFLDVNTTPWYWSSGNGSVSFKDWGWKTDAIDPVTDFPVYTPGEYQVTVECNENNLGYVGTTKTVTLEEEQPTITVDPASLIRGERFYTTITGIPNTTYILWIKDCVACPNGCCSDPMTGACCDQPPMMIDGQEGVYFVDDELPFNSSYPEHPNLPDGRFWVVCLHKDPSLCPAPYCPGGFCGQCGKLNNGEFEGDYYRINNTLIQWCGCLCTKTLDGIMPDSPEGGKYYYALVLLDENGERTVEWQTTTCTAPTTYKVHTQRWEPGDVCTPDEEYLQRPYAEACVNVQQGVVTIQTDVCDEPTDTSYLGETVHISGTNTDSPYTYLFIKGPCQSCKGENMTVTNTVKDGDGTTFTKVKVKSDKTWEYNWYTRDLQIDLGQYTIYASSMPNDAPTLEGVPCTECEGVGVSCAAWDKTPFTFLEPTLTADVNPKIIQIICCSGPSITISGEALGLRGEAIGQQYNTVPIGIWVFGENKVAGWKYFFDTDDVECVSGEFSYDLKEDGGMETLDLTPGTYTVVVQHPMYNHRLDIIPETSPNRPDMKWICNQSDWCPWLRLFEGTILQDEVWYPDVNRKFVVSASPIRWSKLFVIDGPDRLAGTAALNALLAGFNDPNIDDNIAVLTFKVESNNAIQAGFSGTPTSGGAPLSVFFTDISLGFPTAWHWDFGDGYTSDEQNPTHVYENVGTYDVTLTVTGLSGSSSITKNAYVTVTTGPTQTGTVTPTPTTPTPSTMNLYSGWNFISTPRALADGHNTASSVFSGVNTGGHSIFTYDAGSTSWQALTANSTVKPLDGIWIYSTASVSVSLTYRNNPLDTPPTKAMYSGWNSIGFSDVNPAAAKDTLQSVQSQWTQLIGYNGASQYYDTSIIKGGSGSHSDTNPMNPFKGYWLFMNAPGTLAAISA
ncbi:MAG: DUF3821 domain-containing protein [Methanolinea sp.]